MTQKQFLKELKRRLKKLPKTEVERSLSFYREMIEDKKEEGMGEEEAVASLGSPQTVAQEILNEAGEFPQAEERAYGYGKERRGLSGITVVLLVVGFPIWFPLLMAALAVVLALTIGFGSIVLSLVAGWFALVASSVGVFVGSFVPIFSGDLSQGLCLMGVSLMLFAGSMALFNPIKSFLKWIWNGLKRGCRRLFARRNRA